MLKITFIYLFILLPTGCKISINRYFTLNRKSAQMKWCSEW
uniref:Uncharacterized protein n=1 Tax=Anguilla anguilla TaxID=7936 RepID=A0A0E9PP18_ANGAN